MAFSKEQLLKEINQEKQWIDAINKEISNFMNDARFYSNSHQISKAFLGDLTSKFNLFERGKKNSSSNAKSNTNKQAAYYKAIVAIKELDERHRADLKSYEARNVALNKQITAKLTGQDKNKSNLKDLIKELEENKATINRIKELRIVHAATDDMFDPTAKNPLNDYKILELTHHYNKEKSTCNRAGDGILANTFEKSFFDEELNQDESRLTPQQKFLKLVIYAFSCMNNCAAAATALENHLKESATLDIIEGHAGIFLDFYRQSLTLLEVVSENMNTSIEAYLKKSKKHFVEDSKRPDYAINQLLKLQKNSLTSFEEKFSRLSELAVNIGRSPVTHREKHATNHKANYFGIK